MANKQRKDRRDASDWTAAKDLVWPAVNTLPQAEAAAQSGAGTAFAVAVLGGLIGGYCYFANTTLAGMDSSMAISGVIFAVLGSGIRKRSRSAAWTAAVLYGAGFVWTISSTGNGNNLASGLIVGGFMLSGFISGVRGTSAIHRFRAQASNGG